MQTRWTRVSEGYEALRELTLEGAPGTLVGGHSEIIHQKRSSLILKVTNPCAGVTEATVWKWIFRRGTWRHFKDLFRSSRATKEFDIGREILGRGLATPVPLAAAEARTGWRLHWSCLVMRWVAFDGTVASLWNQAHETGKTPEWWTVLAREIRHAHDAGITFRDMRPENLLVCPAPPLSICFIDLISAERSRPDRAQRSLSVLFGLLRPRPTSAEISAFHLEYGGHR